MKIKGHVVGISVLHIAVVIFFIAMLIPLFAASLDIKVLLWGTGLILILILIPVYNSYSISCQYDKLLPEYEAGTNQTRIININEASIGKGVKIRGKVTAIKGAWICRPAFTIEDRSGSVVAQRSVPLDEDIKIGDTVEAVGKVMKRFTFFGKVVVLAIGIKKVEAEAAEEQKKLKN